MAPLSIRKQLIETIRIITSYEFPHGLPCLIDEVMNHMTCQDPHIVNCALQLAKLIFKRYELKLENWWEKHALLKFEKPFTDVLVATMNLIETNINDDSTLRVLYSSMVLITKIFYSLNGHIFRQHFKDTLSTWLNVFRKLITIDVPCLHTGVS